MARLKTGPKIILIILLVVGFVFGLRKAAELGWIPTPGVMKALVPEKAVLPDVKDALVQNVDPAALPTASPASVRPVVSAGACPLGSPGRPGLPSWVRVAWLVKLL